MHHIYLHILFTASTGAASAVLWAKIGAFTVFALKNNIQMFTV